ncbi:VanZ family protein [Dysgonomonas sp. BGC7]|uniref:VanZ family protein n=1 Tax=Dysgonomonas sp. BGC7 TaxID=1658008 RepID=UPI0006813D8E|nr:VanZ family protein [Dysgonomonas sp. BGC7]MBD8390072.1 VanZ family protein [Dysgonomonas sp. BGC7]
MLKKIFKYSWPPAIVAIVIFYLCCLIPSDDVPDVSLELPIATDKIVHFLMYFGLAGVASFNYIYDKKGKIIILKLIVFAILVPILYGGLIEILQYKYFPERSGDWYDFWADMLGALASLPLSLWFRRFLINRQHLNENII